MKPASQALLCIFGLGLPVAAQFGVPTLGWVENREAQTLSQVVGIAGSAVVQPAPAFLPRLSRVSLSRNQLFAAGVIARTGQVVLASLSDREVRELGLEPYPDRIFISPGGKFVATYYEAGRRALLLSTDGSSAATAIDLTFLHGTPRSIVVSDAGSLLTVVSSGDSASLYRFSSNYAPQLLATSSAIGALAASRTADDLVFADPVQKRVFRIRDGGTVTPLASSEDGLTAPIAAAYSTDGQRIFVLDGSSRILVFAAGGGLLESVACSCAPDTLEPLSGNATFRLTALSSGPLWILDAEASPARALFVPVLPRSMAAQKGTVR